MSAINAVLHVVFYLLCALVAYMALAFAFVGAVFAIGWWKGWLTDETSAMDILDRLTQQEHDHGR